MADTLSGLHGDGGECSGSKPKASNLALDLKMADTLSGLHGDGGECSGSKPKASNLAPSTRVQRNQAEKKRRDRLNAYISELASIVPTVNGADKTLDKVSILRLSAAYLRLNKSCLHPKRFKSKMEALPSLVLPHLDLIEKCTGGFIIVTTFSGIILYCSNSVHDYLGYQNIDVIGNSIYYYIHKDDSPRFEKKMNYVISRQKKGKKRSKVLKAHMQQKPIPRSNDVKFRKMVFKLSVHENESTEGRGEISADKKKQKPRTKDFGANAIVLMFVEPIKIEPEPDAVFIESHQEGYFTMHGLRGEILYADQRITTITGYTAADVKGKSAYEYIFSSDVPIALFAQKDMFSSDDGTGIITYRLRVKNLRYIYLQSKGQIVYKQDAKSISHFVCFNKLLSDEEGDDELKKFQRRFAPQAMAASALTFTKNEHKELACQTFPDEVLESTVPLFNNCTSNQAVKKLTDSRDAIDINNSHSIPQRGITTRLAKSYNFIKGYTLPELPEAPVVSQSPLDNMSSHYSDKDSEATLSSYDVSSECSMILPLSSPNSNTIHSFPRHSPNILEPVFDTCLNASVGQFESGSVQSGITQKVAVAPPICSRQVDHQNGFSDIFSPASSFEDFSSNVEFLPGKSALNSGSDAFNALSDPFEIKKYLNDEPYIQQNNLPISEELLDFVDSNANLTSSNLVGLTSNLNYMSSPSKSVKVMNIPNENTFSVHKATVSKNKDLYQIEHNNHNILNSFAETNVVANNSQAIPLNELHTHSESSDLNCLYSENIQNAADCISFPIQSHNAMYPNAYNGNFRQANGSGKPFPLASSYVTNNGIVRDNSSLPNEYICSPYSTTAVADDEINALLGQSFEMPTKRKKVEISNISFDAQGSLASNSYIPQDAIGNYVKNNEYLTQNALSLQPASIPPKGFVKSNENSLSNELYYELDLFFQKLPNPSSSPKFGNSDSLLQNYNPYDSTSHCISTSTRESNRNSDLRFLAQ